MSVGILMAGWGCVQLCENSIGFHKGKSNRKLMSNKKTVSLRRSGTRKVLKATKMYTMKTYKYKYKRKIIEL